MELSFVIPFPLVPKKRPRLGRHGVYTPSRTIRFEKSVGMLALAARPARWPLDAWGYTLEVRTPAVGRRADLSNLVKAIEDGLNGIGYRDDKAIRGLHIYESPSTETMVWLKAVRPGDVLR